MKFEEATTPRSTEDLSGAGNKYQLTEDEAVILAGIDSGDITVSTHSAIFYARLNRLIQLDLVQIKTIVAGTPQGKVAEYVPPAPPAPKLSIWTRISNFFTRLLSPPQGSTPPQRLKANTRRKRILVATYNGAFIIQQALVLGWDGCEYTKKHKAHEILRRQKAGELAGEGAHIRGIA